ncbi:MAG TPA: hypothetical protein VGQ36_12340 [Thermoanaerobaculia bacterium]|nr:hypothetical protein [Thermoanaerobaculia bacterium]
MAVAITASISLHAQWATVGGNTTTSDNVGTGVAMRSVPFEINGRRFHQPGTIIGKALEPLPSGEGEILVLLSLQ